MGFEMRGKHVTMGVASVFVNMNGGLWFSDLVLFYFVSSVTGRKHLQMGVGEHGAGKGISGQRDGRLKDGGSCSCHCGLLNKRQEVQLEVGGTPPSPLDSLLVPNLC